MTSMEEEYSRLAQALREAKRVCIIVHIRPDGDTIGSATALAHVLTRMGKQAQVVLGQTEPIDSKLLSIPGAADIELTDTLPTGYDLYVAVDCGDLSRTGLLAPALAGVDNLACVDHHASNPGFGHISIVDAECEATTVALVPLFDEMGVSLDKASAHSLYAGLLTDTGSFRWGRPVMHDFARRFMDFGLDPSQIAIDVMDSTTVAELGLLARGLSTLRVISAGDKNIALVVADEAVIGDAPLSATESLVTYIRALEGTDLAAVLKQQGNDSWTVSLRSATVDCAAIALEFGGGGHVPAAGYSARGTAAQVIERLVKAVEGKR